MVVRSLCSGKRNIFFLPKPINASLLHESLVKTEEISAGAVKLIELRGLKETLYVTDEEIRYAIQSGEYTDVTLTGDRCIRIHGDPGILYDEIRGQHEVFVMASNSTVLNVRHVAFIGPMSVRMCDGKKLAAGGDVRAYVRHKMNK